MYKSLTQDLCDIIDKNIFCFIIYVQAKLLNMQNASNFAFNCSLYITKYM